MLEDNLEDIFLFHNNPMSSLMIPGGWKKWHPKGVDLFSFSSFLVRINLIIHHEWDQSMKKNVQKSIATH